MSFQAPPATKAAVTLRLVAHREALEIAITNGIVHHEQEGHWLSTLTDTERQALDDYDAAVAKIKIVPADAEETA